MHLQLFINTIFCDNFIANDRLFERKQFWAGKAQIHSDMHPSYKLQQFLCIQSDWILIY